MFERARHILEENGISPSFQRVKVLEYLLGDPNHPTAEIIYQGLTREVPTLSKATVYNTLNLFVEKKLVSTMSADKYETRYDLITQEHGHFVCKECGAIVNFPYRFKDHYPDLDGFQIEQEEIVIKGICKECLAKEKE